MKYLPLFLAFLMGACDTTNVYPTKVVETPAASAPTIVTEYVNTLDCKSVGGFKHGDACVSNCTLCSDQEVCIDIDKDSWPDTCVQGTSVVPPVSPTETNAPTTKWCDDNDKDGYTVCDGSCLTPSNMLCGDCNDQNDEVHPGVEEVCDDVDQNCDGNVDFDLMPVYRPDTDGDGFGDAFSKVTLACKAPEGYVLNQMDCNDSDVTVYPGADELCGDKVDNNCNVQVDELPCVTYSELCGDGIDNDKDGMTDEYCVPNVDPSEVDADGDGFQALVDCNDNDTAIHPGLNNCPTFNGLTKASYKLVLVWGGADNSPWTANVYFKSGMSANDLQFSSKAFFDNSWEKKSFPQYNYTATDLDKNSSHVAFNVFGYPGYWYLCGGTVVDTISISISKELPKIYLVSGGVWQEVSNKLEVLAANDLEVVKGPIYGGDYNKSKPAYCAAMLQL